ncbi:MAG: sigma-54-dependent Fis family transcriptional regulator [Desulfatitalea sp.]|nr:sigma-54-dependent Fis family transcriptional regulator [Desulfatitalea sp.]
MAKLLIVDDDAKICSFLLLFAQEWGHAAIHAGSARDGLALARAEHCDLILLDLDLPDGNGLRILPELIDAPSHPEVIIITGTGDINGAKLAFQYGAWDFVSKPFTMEEIALPVSRALAYRKEKRALSTPLNLKRDGILGSSQEIRNCLEDVARASATDASVLISGETGTGKELFARAIHENSKRAEAGFIAVDCGAIPESLAEGLFFGYEKGAFTGAAARQEGIIAQAAGGTLFLDEIGDLSANIQKALLRALQERRIRPLGAAQEVPVDFRVVAATNRDLSAMVVQKRFREDLLFRIRAFEIKLPPLRVRKDDIEVMAVSKIHQICRHYDLGMKGIAPEFIKSLQANDWPGNVRELLNVLEYALAAAGDDPTLHPKHLPPEYRASTVALKYTPAPPGGTGDSDKRPMESAFPTLLDHRSMSEAQYLQMLIERVKGDRDMAVALAGISQSGLYSLMKKHHLTFADHSGDR